MAVHNKSNAILNINCPDSCKNKVYINPNFNRPQINVPSNAIMHVNPKFSYLVSNVQSNILNKNKIYVNPNFIKSRNVGDNYECLSINVNNDVIPRKNIVVNTLMASYQQQSVDKEARVLQVPVAQSRYCLVRQSVTNEPLKVPTLEKAKNTFKLNKYKSVPWRDIKRNLDSVKNVNNNSTYIARLETSTRSPINEKVSSSPVLNRRKNEFKLINYNNLRHVKEDKIKTKIYSDTYKKLYKSNQASQSKVKKIKGNLKKNNIPCPLFRKFGKCLRNTRGGCEFLHDKKHVSICRKFIKGLCHDKDCLLSHDLTTKKMPTCYFYLKGTCTKLECPYLHVKLNEKTKICPDFVKGYCEKGSKCLQRHVNVTERKNRRTSQLKDSLGNKYSESGIGHINMYNLGRQDEEVQNIEIKCVNSAKSYVVKGENYAEYRYYEEHRDDASTNESCEIIKPLRCKLGTLPSFIQL